MNDLAMKGGRTPFRDHPVGWKLTMLVVPSSVLLALLFTAAYAVNEWSSVRRALLAETELLAQVVGSNTAGALSFADEPGAAATLASLGAIPSIIRVCLYSAPAQQPEKLMTAYPSGQARDCPPDIAGVTQAFEGDTLRVLAPVRLLDERIGGVLIVRDFGDLRKQLSIQIAIGVLVLLLSLAVVVGIQMYFLRRVIMEPIERLSGTALRIGQSRNYDIRASKLGQDEIGTLVDSFNAMLDQIQSAQQQLVESEKMASLGGLVAGVSHEVSTPVGIGLTAVSNLSDESEGVRLRYHDGQLTREEMERYLTVTRETTDLVQTHLRRAADIISSFRQVAVDQSAGDARPFEIGDYVREVILGLSPKFKKTPYRIKLDIHDAIEITGYPGAIAQIVTNLVMNALIHAFDGRDSGTIKVSVRAGVNRDVRLSVTDDGVGIPPENHKHIFEPFFTTKRGSGGSGLGLNIVYNLVTQKLRGRIDLESRPGEGASFVIHFPKSPN